MMAEQRGRSPPSPDTRQMITSVQSLQPPKREPGSAVEALVVRAAMEHQGNPMEKSAVFQSGIPQAESPSRSIEQAGRHWALAWPKRPSEMLLPSPGFFRRWNAKGVLSMTSSRMNEPSIREIGETLPRAGEFCAMGPDAAH